MVPEDLQAEAEQLAKASLEDSDEEEDDDL